MQNAYMEIILTPFRAERETNRLSGCVCVDVCKRERERDHRRGVKSVDGDSVGSSISRIIDT